MNVIGAQQHTIAGSGDGLGGDFQVGEPSGRTIVETPPIDIGFRPIQADHHTPGLMIVGRHTTPGQPGDGFDQKPMFRRLVKNRDAEPLVLIGRVKAWLQPVAIFGQGRGQRGDAGKNGVDRRLAGH